MGLPRRLAWLLAALVPCCALAASSGQRDRRLLYPPQAVWDAFVAYNNLLHPIDGSKAAASDDPRLLKARGELMAKLNKIRRKSGKKSLQELVDSPKAPVWLAAESGIIRRFLEDSGQVKPDGKDYSYCGKESYPCPVECDQGASRCQGDVCTADISCHPPRYDPFKGG